MDINDIDDFADDKDIQESRRLQAEYNKLIADCETMVCEEFNLQESEIEPDLSAFEIPKSIGTIDGEFLYYSPDNSSPFRAYLIAYQWSHHSSRNSASGNAHCWLGSIQLTKEFPLTFIYKETVKEKIVNWFVKGDVDFKEHKKFSGKFHVVTKDKEKLTWLLNNKPLDELTDFPEMEIEISGTECMFRVSKETIDIEPTKQFIQLAKKLIKILG